MFWAADFWAPGFWANDFWVGLTTAGGGGTSDIYAYYSRRRGRK